MAKLVVALLVLALVVGVVWGIASALTVREESIAEARAAQVQRENAWDLETRGSRAEALALALAIGIVCLALFAIIASLFGGVALARRAISWANMPQMVQTSDFGAIKVGNVVLTWRAGGIPVAVVRQSGSVRILPVTEGLAIQGVQAWSSAQIAASASAAVRSVEGARAFQAVVGELKQAAVGLIEARHTVTVAPAPTAPVAGLVARPNDKHPQGP